MHVLKFGGTSVGSAAAISKVAEILKGYSPGNKLAVVVSAMSGITDKLIAAGTAAEKGDEGFKAVFKDIEQKHIAAIQKLFPLNAQSSILSKTKKSLNELELLLEAIFNVGELTKKMQDRIMSYGELMSSCIIAEKLKLEGFPIVLKDSRELIVTDSSFGNAAVDFTSTYNNIQQHFTTAQWTLFPGFIAATALNETTTLGRGGSDYTAAIIAGAVHASALEIWTDVNGMMTCDPRLVPQAQSIPSISYEEGMELSHFGAKVIYPPTIQPAKDKLIPVWIKNTFEPTHAGTVIQEKPAADNVVTGISAIQRLSLLTIKGSGMVGVPGISMRLFGALYREKINVIMITQSSSEHSITIAVNEADTQKACGAVTVEFKSEMQQHGIDPVTVERELSVVALVGDNMRNHHGISGRMFTALGRNGINIRAIAQGSNEKNISAVVKFADLKKALNALHETFFESQTKQLNLFIAGVGNVGKSLLQQLQAQTGYLKNTLGIQLRLHGLVNSKKMIAGETPIDMASWGAELEKGEATNLQQLAEKIKKLNLYNTVFVDNTASPQVAELYATFLEHGISVVTCNKIACSAGYSYYNRLKELARGYNATFLFETNVGAGLPVINTLNDLIRSGDKVEKIEAVLSGTLNFVFNNFTQAGTFKAVVEQAQKEGYTEPDPRIDLSGVDVARKILILCRESGMSLELADVVNESFLPQECLEAASVAEFYKNLDKYAPHFDALLKEAEAQGKRLKYVARLENGKASVGLKMVEPGHAFYNLQGKDNIVQFTTLRYPAQPLTIRGAGAGAEVTASGIFADIIKTVPRGI